MSHTVYIRFGTCILVCIASRMNTIINLLYLQNKMCVLIQEHHVMCYGSKVPKYNFVRVKNLTYSLVEQKLNF